MMCALVTIGGAITFVNSDSILKKGYQEQEEVAASPKDIKILIDIIDNKLYIVDGEVVIKTYPIASGKSSTPSPVGEWIIVSKSSWGEGFGGKWLGLNVPWGTLVLEQYYYKKQLILNCFLLICFQIN
jgi:hypothetical protein